MGEDAKDAGAGITAAGVGAESYTWDGRDGGDGGGMSDTMK